jgi:hypothetical protein
MKQALFGRSEVDQDSFPGGRKKWRGREVVFSGYSKCNPRSYDFSL